MSTRLLSNFEAHILSLDAQCVFLNQAIEGANLAMPGVPEIVKEIRALRTQTSEVRANMERVRNLLVDHFSGHDTGVNGESSNALTNTQPPDINTQEMSFPKFAIPNPRPSREIPPAADHLDTKTKRESSEDPGDGYPDIDKATRAAIAEGRRLFVGNLSLRAREKELKAFFGPTKVESILIPRSLESGQPGRFGFVTMTTTAHAKSAILELNNQLLCGRPMHIRVSNMMLNSQMDSYRPTKRRASEGPSEISEFTPQKKAKIEDSRYKRPPVPDYYIPPKHLKPRDHYDPPAIEFEDVSEEVDRRLRKSALRRRRPSQLLNSTKKRKRGDLDDSESEEKSRDCEGRLTPPPGMSPLAKKQKQSAP